VEGLNQVGMYWIKPGIETDIAYAACFLLVALLILLVRNRKKSAKVTYLSYARSERPAAKPVRRKEPARSIRRETTPAQNAGRITGSGLEFAPRERATSKAPDNVAIRLAAPHDLSVRHNLNEVKMNSPSFPFESLDPIAMAQISTFASPDRASTTQDSILALPALPPGPALAEVEVAAAPAIEAAPSPTTSPAQEVAVEAPVAIATQAEAEPTSSAVAGVVDEPQILPANAVVQLPGPANLLSFYGLRQQPFDVTPDPAYLYFTPSRREALASLKQGIEHFRGFMMLIAEPGMGKTTLLNKLMEEVSDSARVVFLFQTQCTSQELLCYILNELQVDHTGMDIVAMHRALNQALLEEMLRGRRFVLIVDEAQNLQEPVLETVRLLSDFETTHSKLIQIVLAGQPQLADTLMRDSLVQLRQRIAVLSNLTQLTAEETAEYVQHRLRAAGWSGSQLFTSEALAQIAESSEGVPRRINNLCFNSLLAAFDRGLEMIDADIVKEVAGRLNLVSLVRRPQAAAAPPPPAATEERATAADLARELMAALAPKAKPDAELKPAQTSEKKPAAVLTGMLTEKVRSQGWKKEHEYRILVSLSRDTAAGVSVAERYYCASLYVDEAQCAALQANKPVRIKIEQD
jgi:general secretion pathway protein A